MPILIKRPNGKNTPLVNGDYLSSYYFIPKEILDKCPQELSPIPREPALAIWQDESRKIIESDLFRLLIIDAYSWMVWPYMGMNRRKEIYSGYDPAWKLSHLPELWIRELMDRKHLPDTVTMLKVYNGDPVGYMSIEEVDAIMREVVPAVMEKYNMYEIIETAKEFRCFEDFDYRYSTEKIDFYRKWYHTRSKVGAMLSLEKIKKEDEEGDYEPEDMSAAYEDKVISEDYCQRFKERLSEKDIKILELRVEGFTYEEIAERLGYKNHSGVLKRMRAIKKEFLKYEQQ
jgi:hypothetical protein